MPRLPRIDLPGMPQHLVQRGVDRQPCFFCDEDRRRYLAELRVTAGTLDCHIHAYVLMSNHVHLLATPTARGDLGRMMQSLGRRYVRYINDRHGRTGTLWEGRFRACLIESEHYLLLCQRYIELNPIRAAVVADPGEYPWSSYRSNALGAQDALLRSHAVYDALGPDAAARRDVYRRWIAQAMAEDDLAAIRIYLQRQHALGTDRFQQHVSAILGRRAEPGRNGRPRKTGETVL